MINTQNVFSTGTLESKRRLLNSRAGASLTNTSRTYCTYFNPYYRPIVRTLQTTLHTSSVPWAKEGAVEPTNRMKQRPITRAHLRQLCRRPIMGPLTTSLNRSLLSAYMRIRMTTIIIMSITKANSNNKINKYRNNDNNSNENKVQELQSGSVSSDASARIVPLSHAVARDAKLIPTAMGSQEGLKAVGSQ